METGYFDTFSLILSFDSPRKYSSLTTPVKIALTPYSEIPFVSRPITPSVAIPPSIPPGPSAAKAAVIAAAPVNPVAAIAISSINPGTPNAATFDTIFSRGTLFFVFL